ncbi:hypothetical protein BBO99_00000973 [Phytophthora kernoviae]|uniref:Tubulin-tyrosine ligase n=2 Tax=Phytophthora kernoviae TaxID=325452 RepID=A0A3R7K2Z0_9STRA|nr:hypothetical protein G195_003065 [Phytophthora kernoviae 00238/432]KAG2529932.1 hypothetical protein JM16_001731 [Phytophthora kernoviae]KAG2531749.1 hypothetical protein JM18_001001 [Phytophthora kernoviae]RLN46505.1 hypothetical protein BBI17_000875 [Phytophthora kernoviae]RLN84820.1 hypothetical protein BBO99_00000973 [Phytophthora kernoviae]
MALLFAADDKFGDVVEALEARGWRRLPYVGIPKFDLKWTNYSKVAWSRVTSKQFVNHFQHSILFSRKDLFTKLMYAQATQDERGQTLMDGCFPRTFDLSQSGDQRLLKQWFLYTQAVTVLKNSMSGKPSVTEAQSRAALELAKTVTVSNLFKRWRLETKDPVANTDTNLDGSELLTFASGSAAVRLDCNFRKEAGALLKHLEQHDPQFHAIDSAGSNVWICKPSNLSQGRGIELCSSLHELRELMSQTSDHEEQENGAVANEGQSSSSRTKWIVQKYIERPLLLQNGRKFDIRQWVLLTELEPEPIAYWFYRSYLRFCSRPFELTRLQDRFTHLSNYSIQQHFVPEDEDRAAFEATSATKQDANEFEPMWSSEQFRDTLRHQHGRDVWNDTILPQMQSTARIALHAVIPKLKAVGRGFEWLGFDFLVDDNHHVWLLEVNVSPDVSHSTNVTAEMVPKATVDTLNLVLDPEGSRSPDNGWLPFSLQ